MADTETQIKNQRSVRAARLKPVSVSVLSPDGVRLHSLLVRPGPGRWPTVLRRTPYPSGPFGRSGDRAEMALLGRLVAHGYAVMTQDVRGRGSSGGAFRPFENDGRDARHTVAWIRRQPWSDGRVVMAGESYGGLLQLQAVGASPGGIDAIAPDVSGAFRPGFYPGGAVALGRIDVWLRRLIAESGVPAEAIDGWSPRELFHQHLVPGTDAWRVGAPIRRWLERRSDLRWLSTIGLPERPVPAIHTTGFFDMCATTAVSTYLAWSAAADDDAPQELTLGPWTHDLGAWMAGEVEEDADLATERRLSLFDRALGRAVPRPQPPAASFVWGANRWWTGKRWPPPAMRPWEFVLARGEDGGGALAANPSVLDSDKFTFQYDPLNPVPTLVGAGAVAFRGGPTDHRPIEARPDVLTFTSGIVPEGLEIACLPIASLAVSSSASATTFVARLTVVEPDGRSINLAEGSWSGRMESLPSLARGAARQCLIELGPVHVAPPRGCRLRLQITSSSYPDLYPDPNTGHDLRGGPPPRVAIARQVVYAGSEACSTLHLLAARG